MHFIIRGFWAPRPYWEDVPGYVREILAYHRHLAKIDPTFTSIRIPHTKDRDDGAVPSAKLVEMMRRKALVMSFDNQGSGQPYRSLMVGVGSEPASNTVTIHGDEAFFEDGDAITRLMLDMVQVWSMEDARISSGRMVNDVYEPLFWKRWSQPGNAIEQIQPIPEGYASCEQVDGGSLYTWPEWEPRLCLHDKDTELP